MQTELHPANERGHANHGWLDTWHNFSFAEYFNPVREHFGALRVLNDDTIKGGRGFGKHPHNNMEIISIPLQGQLEHRDSMGHIEVIRPGDVQVMSAGTGILHSEYNHSPDQDCKFLQIWIYTRNKNITPRYDQATFNPDSRRNLIQLLVTPDDHKEDGILWIHQDAWISATLLDQGSRLSYNLHKKDNYVFAFTIEGEITIEGNKLVKRDAIAIKETTDFELSGNAASEVLIIEIPEK